MKDEIQTVCPECSAITLVEVDIPAGEEKWIEYKCVACNIELRIQVECVLKPQLRRNSDPELVTKYDS